MELTPRQISAQLAVTARALDTAQAKYTVRPTPKRAAKTRRLRAELTMLLAEARRADSRNALAS